MAHMVTHALVDEALMLEGVIRVLELLAEVHVGAFPDYPLPGGVVEGGLHVAKEWTLRMLEKD